MSEESKDNRIISFKKYRTWAKKFMLASMLRGYNMVLTKVNPKVPKYNKILKEMEKESVKLHKANQKAYLQINFSMSRRHSIVHSRKISYKRLARLYYQFAMKRPRKEI